MFEHLHTGQPDSTHMLKLQCVLTSRDQEAYSSLSSSDCLKYAVLKENKLVPEAYRQRFRSWKRGDKLHVELVHYLSTHFDLWCSAAEVDSHEALCDLNV